MANSIFIDGKETDFYAKAYLSDYYVKDRYIESSRPIESLCHIGSRYFIAEPHPHEDRFTAKWFGTLVRVEEREVKTGTGRTKKEYLYFFRYLCQGDRDFTEEKLEDKMVQDDATRRLLGRRMYN